MNLYHNRQSIRLRGYDYRLAGAYFLTIVTNERKHLFGTIQAGAVRLSPAGWIVRQVWLELPNHFPPISLDAFCVMPNHIHGIVVIQDQSTAGLPEIVRTLKSFTTRRINAKDEHTGRTIWQRNYYEHIIRSQAEWEKVNLYIVSNPENWEHDPENSISKK